MSVSQGDATGFNFIGIWALMPVSKTMHKRMEVEDKQNREMQLRQVLNLIHMILLAVLTYKGLPLRVSRLFCIKLISFRITSRPARLRQLRQRKGVVCR